MSDPAQVDRWLGANCRVLRAMFAACGQRAASVDDDGLAVLLTSLAGQFAFHAGLLYDVLPVHAGVDRDALVDEPIAGVDEAIGALAELGSPETCALLARVLVPRLLSGVEVRRASVDPATDGPLARALTLIERDLLDARSSLERICERLLAVDGALDSAAAACAKSERGLVAASVVVGLVPPARGGWGG